MAVFLSLLSHWSLCMATFMNPLHDGQGPSSRTCPTTHRKSSAAVDEWNEFNSCHVPSRVLLQQIIDRKLKVGVSLYWNLSKHSCYFSRWQLYFAFYGQGLHFPGWSNTSNNSHTVESVETTNWCFIEICIIKDTLGQTI